MLGGRRIPWGFSDFCKSVDFLAQETQQLGVWLVAENKEGGMGTTIGKGSF